MLSQDESRKIIEKTLGHASGSELEVTLSGGERGDTRFAVNTATTSGFRDVATLVVTARYGKRSGSATTNSLDDDAAIERVVRAAEAIAKFSPEDPETMPLLGPQQYTPIAAYDEATAKAGPDWRSKIAEATIAPSKAKNLVAAGFVENGGDFTAIGNAKGLFGYHTSTSASFTTTVRTGIGTQGGSGWATTEGNRISEVDGAAAAARAIQKAELSASPVAIEPGKYTVILEPTAVADLVTFMAFFMNARAADEGRSFMSKAGGGNRKGEKFFGDMVTIYTDPQNGVGPGAPFAGDGLPARRMEFVKNGVVTNLFTNRYWAEKTKTEPTPFPTNLIMEGGKASVDEMIASTERGVLVTRLWYIRLVDQKTVLLTGLTRDGTFLVERGKIKSAIKNFRFNESPAIMLNNIEAMSPAVRVTGSEGGGFPTMVPALKVANFTFTSISDAV
jgi:predicted Zn-dependent protease